MRARISEVKFLTFGALLLLAYCGIEQISIKEIFNALGSAGLGLGATGVTLKIIEKGMKLHRGFNIYASFMDWPKLA